MTEIEYVGRVINERGTIMHNETITKLLDFPLSVYFKQRDRQCESLCIRKTSTGTVREYS